METCKICSGTGFTNHHLIPLGILRETRRERIRWAYGAGSAFVPKENKVRLCTCCGDEDEMWWRTGVPGIHEGVCRGLTYEQRQKERWETGSQPATI